MPKPRTNSATPAEKEKVMSEIVVHGVPGSPFLRSVLLGLEEKKAPYRLHAFGPGEFKLYESQAILRYLDDIFPEPRREPADPRAAARMNQLIGINDWYL